jgi:hypothetical protein
MDLTSQETQQLIRESIRIRATSGSNPEYKESYTDVDPHSYWWKVGTYNVFLEKNVTQVSQSDKSAIIGLFRKLRDEHIINWSRNYLYEFKEERKPEVRALLLSTIRSTDRFDVLKSCLYLLRNIQKNCVIDDYVIRKIPKLTDFLDDYIEPELTDLQRSIMGMSKTEHSLKDLEEVMIRNRGFGKIMEHRKKSGGGDGKKYHLTKMDSIELDLTSDCNLKCFNCDRMCGKAPSTGSMTVEQVKRFIEESKTLDKEWYRIAVTGGEPTLHPDIMEIVGMLLEYREACLPKSSYVQVVSNGYDGASEVLDRIQATYTQEIIPNYSFNKFIMNNNKRNQVVLHSPVNMAPVDNEELKDSEFRNGCWVTEVSGLCLTKHGYYFCGAASAIDRVFGYDVGIRALKDVSMRRILEQRKVLCRLCGRFDDVQSSGSVYYGPDWVVEEKNSPTWEKAFESYKSNQPVLTVF